MNPSSDAHRASPGISPGETNPNTPRTPSNWREALMALIASRIALIQLESMEAAKSATRMIIHWIAALACMLFAWALIIVGAIAALAHCMQWPWHWVALGTAAAHLLVGTMLILLGKPTRHPAFPFTRTEFQKDREWIENFHKNQKSND